MSRVRVMLYGVILGIFITNLIIFSQCCYITATHNLPIVTPSNDKSLDSLISHAPIHIDGDDDFTVHGFSGNGSKTNPYLIEGYSIIDTSGAHGIHIGNTTKHFIVRNCYVETNAKGIYIRNVSNNTAVIANNQLKGNDADGIVVIYANQAIVANNTAKEDHVSLRISRSYGVYAYNNTFIGGSPSGYICAAGIFPSHGGNTILDNNTIDDFNRGIYFRNNTHSAISKNVILSSKEYGGIYLGEYSDYNLITNNSVFRNSIYDGIRLYNCAFNVVSFNVVKDNNGYGCNLQPGAYQNIIHHNSFIDNGGYSSQGFASSSSNTWYQVETSEGNYWSDWKGSGSYAISGSDSYDLYPLSEPVVSDTVNPTISFSYPSFIWIFLSIVTTASITFVVKRKGN